jgi:hypothetical protein
MKVNYDYFKLQEGMLCSNIILKGTGMYYETNSTLIIIKYHAIFLCRLCLSSTILYYKRRLKSILIFEHWSAIRLCEKLLCPS